MCDFSDMRKIFSICIDKAASMQSWSSGQGDGLEIHWALPAQVRIQSTAHDFNLPLLFALKKI